MVQCLMYGFSYLKVEFLFGIRVQDFQVQDQSLGSSQDQGQGVSFFHILWFMIWHLRFNIYGLVFNVLVFVFQAKGLELELGLWFCIFWVSVFRFQDLSFSINGLFLLFQAWGSSFMVGLELGLTLGLGFRFSMFWLQV